MNTQTPQSLDEIFEEGRISEMEKLNNLLKERYPSFSGERLLVAKKDFLQENANAFCDEFNQGSRYKDALWEFDRELVKNKAKFKFNTFSTTFEYTKDDFLIRKGLIDNRLALFVEFFETGSEKISFDLGRKQAWKDFGFGSNSLSISLNEDSKRPQRKKAPFSLIWNLEDRNVLILLYQKLLEGQYIENIDFLSFENNFKGIKMKTKIHWVADVTELVYLMDNLSDFIDSKCYYKNGIRSCFKKQFKIQGCHDIKSQVIYDARRRYSSPDLNDSQKEKIKKITEIIESLKHC